MVRLKGFEPLAHSLEGCCSIQLSYRRIRILKLGCGVKSFRYLLILCRLSSAFRARHTASIIGRGERI
jgi:hypothetical protein